MAQLEKTYLTVCKYLWEVVGIENKDSTTLSTMLKIKGVESFQVGLKNQASTSTLLLLTTNLNKMGLKAEAVTYNSVGSEETKKKMTLCSVSAEDETDSGCLQLFTAQLNGFATGNRSFVFQINLAGVVQDYRVQEVDLLLRNHLWSSFTGKAGTDFELVAIGKRFPVHKYVLAARSSVFAANFRDENRGGEAEDIGLVDAASVQQFIKFVYTGELEGPIKSQHLMQLALTYKMKTLKDLCYSCQAASHEIDEDQMASSGLNLRPGTDGESETRSLSTSVMFSCTWKPYEDIIDTSCITSEAFVYRNEKLFRAQLRKNVVLVPNPDYIKSQQHLSERRNQETYVDDPIWNMERAVADAASSHVEQTTLELVFLSYHHEKTNYKIEEVNVTCRSIYSFWCPSFEMLEKKTSNEKKLQMFSIYLDKIPSSFTFHVKLASGVPNYDLTLADSTLTEQLWVAAVDKVLTDVEFLVTGESISAHRSLLSARSPVFAGMFASGMEEARTGQVRIDDVDPGSFRHFLQFLYTGTLLHSADKAEIFAVADKYQVETLMELCRPSTQPVDIDEITAAFLSCWR